MAARSYGQYCGVSIAAELVAERWALLILRDLLVGPRRYTDLKQGLPKIPTNILSNRLKELENNGVIRRVPGARRSIAYECTDYGQQLEPIIQALGRWGFQKMGEPAPEDVVTPDSVTMALRTAFQPTTAADFAPTDYVLHLAHIALHATVDRNRLSIWQMAPPPPPTVVETPPENDADLVLVVGPELRQLIAGDVTAENAIDHGIVTITSGDPALLNRFAATFHITT